MSTTSFSGPLTAGDRPAGSPGGANVGGVELSQSQVISFNATLVSEAIFYLPTSSRITDITADTLTQFDSATSATLTVGSASAGTQYASGVNAKTAGRQRPTFTGAQLTAMADTGITPVYVTITSVGQPTAGSLRVRIMYVQTQGI